MSKPSAQSKRMDQKFVSAREISNSHWSELSQALASAERRLLSELGSLGGPLLEQRLIATARREKKSPLECAVQLLRRASAMMRKP